jgi:DNA-damage-inducible protein D
MSDKALTVFDNHKIRRRYDQETDTWYLSAVDTIAALIQQPDHQVVRNYWKVLKNRLNMHNQTMSTENCNDLQQKHIWNKKQEKDKKD